MCLVRNVHDFVWYDNTRDTLLSPAEPAVLDQGVTYRGFVNEMISLTCTADGVPLPDIVWLKDGCPLSAHIAQSNRFLVTEAVVPGFRVHVPGAIQSNLTILDSTEKDGGDYMCRATNEIDTAYLPAPHQVVVDGTLIKGSINTIVPNLVHLSMVLQK